MRRKILEKYNEIEYEAFEKYMHVIGANIVEFNKQMEEVD